MKISKTWAIRLSRWHDQFLCSPRRVRRQAKYGDSHSTQEHWTVSVAIAHYNRGKVAFRPLCNLLDHPLVGEVVFFDDGSTEDEFFALQKSVAELGATKRVRIERRENNQGALQTKLDATAACRSDWVLILDSDNTAFSGYLDALAKIETRNTEALYCSPFAFPYFSFKPLAGRSLDFETCCELTRSGLLRKCFIINDGNYLVHRETYLERITPLARMRSDVADVMAVNYSWLSQGGKLEILRRGAYHHRIDPSSFWMRTADESRDRVMTIFELFEKNIRWQDGGAEKIMN